jgi:hypothetical protein
MWFDSELTKDDVRRVSALVEKATPLNIAAACLVSLRGIDIFINEYVLPTATERLKNDNENPVIGLFYRSIGFLRTAVILDGSIHMQTAGAIARSLIEIYLDLELLHRNAIPDGYTKCMSHIDLSKLKAARRVIEFYAKNTDLDTDPPSRADRHKLYVQNNAARIEQQAEALWGKDKNGKLVRPEHWSGSNQEGRAAKISKDAEVLVLEGYDLRNYAVHTGLAGVAGLDKIHFEIMYKTGLEDINTCLLKILRIVGEQLSMPIVVPHYFSLVDQLDGIRKAALCDILLRERGEKQRFTIMTGDPPR